MTLLSDFDARAQLTLLVKYLGSSVTGIDRVSYQQNGIWESPSSHSQFMMNWQQGSHHQIRAIGITQCHNLVNETYQ